MTKLLIVPSNDWDVLKKYLGASDGGVVLLPKPVLDKMPSEAQTALRELNGEELDSYDFGGEPDLAVDIISSPEHYAVDCLIESGED